jgi:hypothetical protein
MKVVSFESTPNPLAVKCVLDRRVGKAGVAGQGPRSYRDAGSAAGDAVARRLFEIEGVTNVLIVGDWITVGKTPGAAWGAIKAGVRRVVSEMEEEG